MSEVEAPYFRDFTVDVAAEVSLNDGDDDTGRTICTIFKRKDVRVSDILNRWIGLDMTSRMSYIEARGGKTSPYRDSGEWSHSRNKDGSLRIGVRVGCSCSHDCCGHLCSLSYNIQLVGQHIIVITNRSYNY